MSTPTKEVEVAYEECPRRPTACDQLYRITIALRPDQVTTTTITTNLRSPLPTYGLICETAGVHNQLVEVTGQTLRFKSWLPAGATQASAILLVRVTDGLAARRVPL